MCLLQGIELLLQGPRIQAGVFPLPRSRCQRLAAFVNLLPQLLAHSAATVVYGKGYDMGGMYRLNEGLRWQADLRRLAEEEFSGEIDASSSGVITT